MSGLPNPPPELAMPPITTYTIRPATDADQRALELVAALDSRRSLTGDILLAEKDGSIAAALSLTDRRVVADPFRATADARDLLQARAASLDGVTRTPLLRDRVRAAVQVARTRSAQAA
jgi:hypothetical protein